MHVPTGVECSEAEAEEEEGKASELYRLTSL